MTGRAWRSPWPGCLVPLQFPTGSLDPAFGHNGYAPVGFPFGGFAATNVTVSGVISRVEARLQGRRGPRIMQPC
jgi:hypothetical protein